MKVKTGACIDCGNSGGLIARRCQSCYWKYRRKVKKESPAERLKIANKGKAKKELDIFFASQILNIPTYCEECGTNLTGWRSINPKAIIAHILPKRKTYGFPSVATHPQNRMFFCVPCHTDFDNKGSDHIAKMKSLPVMRERLKEFRDRLTESEKERIPEPFK